MADDRIQLLDDRTVLLATPFAVDGRVCTHPPDARGWASMNAYALVDPDDHSLVLVDGGYSTGLPGLLGHLDQLAAPGSRLSLWPLRMGEFNSVCNVLPIARQFTIDKIYGTQDDPIIWVALDPDQSADEHANFSAVKAVTGDVVHIGSGGRRAIDVLYAPLRLLRTQWLYDRSSRILFSSDAFTHSMGDSAGGPWLITAADEDDTTVESVLHYLLSTRFWWLAGAHSRKLREEIDRTFQSHDIEAIAPAWGRALCGRSVVERHVGLVDQAIELAAQMEPRYLPGLAADASSRVLPC